MGAGRLMGNHDPSRPRKPRKKWRRADKATASSPPTADEPVVTSAGTANMLAAARDGQSAIRAAACSASDHTGLDGGGVRGWAAAMWSSDYGPILDLETAMAAQVGVEVPQSTYRNRMRCSA